MELVFGLLVFIGWLVLGLLAIGVVAFLLWLLYASYLRTPEERPGRKVDYRQEDVE